MIAVRVLEASLLISAVATGGVFAPIVQYRIFLILRRRHGEAFDRLGIRSPSFLWREDREADTSSAAFDKFFSSGNHRNLDDQQLDVLWQRVRMLRRLSAVGFALFLISLVAFRNDPNSLWDFLVDLSQY